jgi:hypothetical protein
MTAYSLLDRAVFDASGGHLGPRHPLKRQPRLVDQAPWTRREVRCSKAEAAAVAERLAGHKLDILAALNYPKYALDQKKKPVRIWKFNVPGERWREQAKIIRRSAPKKLSPRSALDLCLAVATLHAGDDTQPDVTLAQIRNCLVDLRRLKAAASALHKTDISAGASSLTSEALRDVQKARFLFEKLTDKSNGGRLRLALQWLAATHFEAKCRLENVPSQAVDELWDYDPFAFDHQEPSDERRQRLAAREHERASAALASSIALALEEDFDECMRRLSSTELDDAVNEAQEEVERAEKAHGARAKVDGKSLALTRLHWDCLSLWRLLEMPRPLGPHRKPFDDFVVSIYGAATGRTLPQGEARLSAAMRTPAQNALKSLKPDYLPVLVMDPVAAQNGRFMQYVALGPTGWRRRRETEKEARPSDSR